MRKNPFLLLGLIFLFQAALLISYLSFTGPEPTYDTAWHAMISLNDYNQITGNTDINTGQLEKIYPIFGHANNYYPPFFYWFATPFYLFFGTDYPIALLSNLVFSFMLIITMYLIGKKLLSDQFGLIMAFFSATIPLYNILIQNYMLDLALAAMVSLGYLMLLYSDNFNDLRYSILFGIVFGLGLLTKWTYPIFLAVPVLFSFFMGINIKRKNWINALMSFCIALIISSLWYLVRLKTLVFNLVTFIKAGILEGDPNFLSLSGLFYYVKVFIFDYSIIFLALFILGVFLSYKSFRRSKVLFAGLLQIIFAYVLFSLLPNKDPRFIAPVFIFMIIFSALGLGSFKNKQIRSVLTIFVIIAALSQAILSYSFVDEPGNTDIDEALMIIGNDSSVCIISESQELNDINLPYYSYKAHVPVGFMVGNGCVPRKFDYIILGEIEQTWRSYLFEDSLEIIDNNPDDFREVYNGTVFRILKNLKIS